jgi:hypothetical protein
MIAAATALVWNLPGATVASSQTRPAAASAEPTLVGQFGVWGAYVAAPGGRKTCFALAKPTSSKTNPPDRPRDPIYAFISTRPGDKVKDEVSVIVGYPLKTDVPASIEVAGARYDMYAEDDGLWIRNAAEEARLVEALRAGAEAVVRGVSTRGTETTDVFSLKGVTQALDKVAQECRS